MKHERKTWPEPFRAKWDGAKVHEIRREDSGRFNVGDVILEREWVPCPGPCEGGTVALRGTCPRCDGARTLEGYTGREILETVTHVDRDAWGLPRGLVVLSVRVESRGDRG